MVKVFANDKSGQDLVVLGKVKMDLRNGKVVESDFAANIILQGDKIDSMQIYAVSGNKRAQPDMKRHILVDNLLISCRTDWTLSML